MVPDADLNLSPHAGTTTPAKYFLSVYELFESAGHAARGFVQRTYSIAGCRLGLRFAGPALVRSITQAFDHLQPDEDPEFEDADSKPTLTVCIWDSESTGQRMRAPEWQHEDYLARGVIQGYNDDRIYTAFQYGSSAVNMLDLERDLAIFWVPAASDLAYWEKGAPLRTILHWWFSQQQRQLVHAAAVGHEAGGVLIGGKGGSGKSSTALACLQSNLLYASDDYVLIGMDAEPMAYSLYSSAKLDGDHLQRLPDLVPLISNPDRLEKEKALLFVNQHFPARISRAFPIKAILLPRITGRADTSLTRTSTAKALAALAPSTIFQLPRAGHQTFTFLAELVRRVPCYSMDLGTNPSLIPAAIETLL